MATENPHLLSYPVFEPNQVLTDRDLNRLIHSLDQQSRFSRVYLMGMGIACGLEVSIHTDEELGTPAIRITPGCGLSSEGHLLFLSGQPVRPVLNGKQEDAVRWARNLTHYRRAEIQAPESQYMAARGRVYELLDTTAYERLKIEEDNPDVARLNERLRSEEDALLLDEYTVVLLYDYQDAKRDHCLDQVSGMGRDRSYVVRVLLLRTSDVRELIKESFSIELRPDETLEDYFHSAFGLPALRMPRMGLSHAGESGAQIDDIVSFEVLKARYLAACGAAIEAIAEAYGAAHNVFSPLFSAIVRAADYDPGAFAGLHAALQQQLADIAAAAAGQSLHVQYFYDYLRDLMLAYEAFYDLAFALMDDCMPGEGRFPRHLLLGEISFDGETHFVEQEAFPRSIYRTAYTQPSLYNGNALRMQQVSSRYRRMQAMAGPGAFRGWDLVNDAGQTSRTIRIVPESRYKPAFEGREIPGYLDQATVAPYWNYEGRRRGRTSAGNPLQFDLGECDFFRIEGFTGDAFNAAFESLQEMQRRFNLPFDIHILKLDEAGEPDEELRPVVLDEGVLASMLESLREVLRTRIELAVPKAPHSKALGDEVRRTLPAALSELLDEAKWEAFRKAYEAFAADPATNLSPDVLEAFEKLRAEYGFWRNYIFEIHLFHHFARLHTGMEHETGVPKGGTYILVYDGSNRIVADFALPYVIASHRPSVRYELAEPDPILLSRDAFCSNDPELYPVILHPPGGTLSARPGGVLRTRDGYFFRPAMAYDLASAGEATPAEVRVDLSYTHPDRNQIHRFQVTVFRAPNAAFEVAEAYCIGHDVAGEIVLSPESGGGIFSFKNRSNLANQIENLPVSGTPPQARLNLANVALKEGRATLEITYTLRHADNGCMDCQLRTVQLYQAPDATFDGLIAAGNLTQDYCYNDLAVTLRPRTTAAGMVSGFTARYRDIRGNELKDAKGDPRYLALVTDEAGVTTFDPQLVDFDDIDDDHITAEITHSIRFAYDDAHLCSSMQTQIVTVLDKPSAAFSLYRFADGKSGPQIPRKGADGIDYVFCENDGFSVEIRADAPPTQNHEKQLMVKGKEIVPATINGRTVYLFDLDAALFPFGEAIEIGYTVTVKDPGHKHYSNSSTSRFRLESAPDALFSGLEAGKEYIIQPGVPQIINLIPDAPGGVFTIDGQVYEPDAAGIVKWDLSAVDLGEGSTQLIRVSHFIPASGPSSPCSATHSVSVRVSVRPDASFDTRLGPDLEWCVVRGQMNVLTLFPAVDGGVFTLDPTQPFAVQNGNQIVFDLREFASIKRIQSLKITHTVSDPDPANTLSDTASQTLSIVLKPDASISSVRMDADAGWVLQANGEIAMKVTIEVAAPVGGDRYFWEFGDGTTSAAAPEGVGDGGTNLLGRMTHFYKPEALEGDPLRQIRLSYTISRGKNCSDTVTANMPVSFGISYVSLINADQAHPGKNQVIPGFDSLEDGAVLDLAKLPTDLLSMVAHVAPSPLGQVRFDLQREDTGALVVQKVEMLTPYALLGDSFGPNNDPNGFFAAWRAVVGSYTLFVNAFAGADNQRGLRRMIRFTVINSAEETPVERTVTTRGLGLESAISPARETLAATPGAEVAALMNRRLAARRATMDELEQDAGLRGTKAFKLARLFLLETHATETDSLAKYEEITQSLLTNLKKASGERLSQYVSVLGIVTHSQLDRLVMADAAQVSEAAQAVLTEVLTKAKAAKVKIKPLRDGWDGAALKKATGAPAVDALLKLLK